MSSLNKIIDGILAQAKDKACKIINEANVKADEILREGVEECTRQKARLESAANAECLEIRKRAQFADRQARRLALLEVKNQVIDEVIAQAKSDLLQNPDEQFSSVWQGDILINNSIDAIFEAEDQRLRDKVYEVLAT